MTLRIAVPNKGTLAEPSATMLAEAGYRQRGDSRELVVSDPDNNVEFFYLRPRDIAIYVGSGRLDLGVTGEDLLRDAGAPAEVLVELGFGRSTFRFAGPDGVAGEPADDVGDEPDALAGALRGKRIATAYPGLLEDFLAEHGVEAEIIALDGAVETAVRLGVADLIADVVSTGTTLRNAGLHAFGAPLFTSQAVLIRPRGAEATDGVDQLVRRLQGVLVARLYVLLDYDVRNDLVEQAVAITPGIEAPTVSPLHTPDWSAVRAMVLASDTNRVMDELWQLGARGILVTGIHACRL